MTDIEIANLMAETVAPHIQSGFTLFPPDDNLEFRPAAGKVRLYIEDQGLGVDQINGSTSAGRLRVVYMIYVQENTGDGAAKAQGKAIIDAFADQRVFRIDGDPGLLNCIRRTSWAPGKDPRAYPGLFLHVAEIMFDRYETN